MNSFTKLGAFLGTLSFAALVAIGFHQKEEVDYINTHQPPTLEVIQNSVVSLNTGEAICSGWFSAKDHKVHTAAHCFDYQAGNAVVTFNDGTQILYETDYVNNNDKDFAHDQATMVMKNKDQIEDKMPKGLEVCNFKPYLGEQIALMGTPLGVERVVFFGQVATPHFENKEANVTDGMILSIQMYEGNSGGPVIDIDHGCVIGSAELLVSVGDGIPVGVAYADHIEQ
jgi:S1-C subfamily serine protease